MPVCILSDSTLPLRLGEDACFARNDSLVIASSGSSLTTVGTHHPGTLLTWMCLHAARISTMASPSARLRCMTMRAAGQVHPSKEIPQYQELDRLREERTLPSSSLLLVDLDHQMKKWENPDDTWKKKFPRLFSRSDSWHGLWNSSSTTHVPILAL